ncbi:conserved protein of unknown function (plasmid) [Rhodovastum atsumiense]|uniref:Uncharacterized protein n=1 Tax=Rhodovastum atsumiense TaxID=504468 RepID=A0A5M6IV93_9PROT|nr:hypothetical protein [Rhodovastum atsumiense]KAA5611859.1 hypothetical protein F1189_12560 [Rhodovastum atsumiense]CAH2606163.1 conserved protein of unknown function [Rhodovastum atsumiense]
MRSSTAWHIVAGRVEEVTIPAEGFEIDLGLACNGYRLLPGNEDDNWRDFTLGKVAEIATRLTPWAEWWCSPNLPLHEEIGEVGGVAYGQPQVGLVRSCWRPEFSISTAFHEAWHLAEPWLTYEEAMAVQAATKRGPEWPTDYLRRECERSARAFQNWAMSTLETGGGRPGRGAPMHYKAFWSVYSGEVGQRALAKRGVVRPERRPPPAPVKVIQWWRGGAINTATV